MKRIFKNKFIACIIAAVLALSAAVFACFSINKNDITVKAEEATPVTDKIYWRYTSSSTTLELSHEELTGGTARGSFVGTQVFVFDSIPWKNQKADITEVVFNSLIAPVSMDNWFYQCKKLERIINIENLNTSNVVGMKSTFADCFKLEALDLSHFDTSKVKSFNATFQYCSSLTSLDVSNISTESATDMAGMFIGCAGLKTINISNFTTPKVTTVAVMFMDCTELEEVNLSNFEAKNITNAIYLFRNNTKLKKFKINDLFAQKTSAVDDSYLLNFPIYRDDGTVCNSQSDINKGGGYFTSPHTHEWVLASSEQLDCTVAGEKKFKCSEEYCTITKTEEIPAKEHTYSVVEVKDSTCTEQGYTKSSCSVCGHTKLDYSALKSHTYEGVTTDPTCTEQGFTTYTCSVCSNSYVGDYVNSRGHDFNAWHTTKPATENEAGEEQHECQRDNCDEVETRSIAKLDHTHTFADGWTSDENYHWHAATCGHTTEKKDSAAHDWNDGEITPPASCTAEGVKTYTCTVCNATKTESVPKVSHEWGEWANNNNATTHIRSCENCTETETEQHTYGVWVTDSEATEEAAGSKHRDCTVCGYSQTQTIPQLNHTHKYDNWTPEAPANCTETGTKGHYTCTCELYFDESHNEISDLTIAALDHNWADEWSKDETNHWHACSRCDEKDSDEAHTYDWVITVEPTEEAEGLKEQHCTVCGAVGDQEVIAKLVVDDNGNVSDLPVLPPNQDYDLEISVKESDAIYVFDDNGKSVSKGFKVELFIVGEDGESTPFDEERTVTLMLHIPDGMEDFKLYKRVGNILEPVSAESYTVEGKTVKIKTTLPNEFVFNAPAPEEPAAGIPWWVWLIVGLVAVAIVGVVIIIIVVIKKKNDGGEGGVVAAAYDDAELKAKLSAQDRKLDEIKEIVDGGFNDVVDDE